MVRGDDLYVLQGDFVLRVTNEGPGLCGCTLDLNGEWEGFTAARVASSASGAVKLALEDLARLVVAAVAAGE